MLTNAAPAALATPPSPAPAKSVVKPVVKTMVFFEDHKSKLERAMPIHLQREIDRLKKQVLSLSAVVEESLQAAVMAIETRDAKLARKVIEGDDEIDQREVDVEEECLNTLALYQPVAVDLRFIVAVLKLNNDLERIGDLAVNIAERAEMLAEQPAIEMPPTIHEMCSKVQLMVRRALESLVNMNMHIAQEVCNADDEIDAKHRSMYGYVEQKMREKPELLDQYMQMLAVSRYLERIADHATNIAEDVLYMVGGEIVRHREAIRRRKARLNMNRAAKS